MCQTTSKSPVDHLDVAAAAQVAYLTVQSWEQIGEPTDPYA